MSKGSAIVTGSAQGIGRAIALRLASDGYDIAVNDLFFKENQLQELVGEIEGKGRKAVAIVGDVSKEEDVQNLVDKCVEELGELSVMVANAGIATPNTNIVDTPLDVWQNYLSINLTGTFLCYKAAAKQLIKQGKGGRIIGACSGAGKRGPPVYGSYATTKFGIRGLTQSLASEIGKYDITVNAYAPGGIDTQLLRDGDASISAALGGPPGTFLKILEARSVLPKKLGTPEDVAALVSYLVSEEAGFITGQSVSLNGGSFYD
ncbi:hypothetical protein M422DRAFT_71667 [Sphaerobolus stellatus SS14]|uniref:Diacetyl reductase [(S)-acetoin forming] n=1 Tax=Sphaerobolus stellatus (strain SS14) TaxID=990650 RepID=A0A0C9UEF9_SPHS4|nr:hypothetical protein M422DRAFT_71667 [Sphaerobolus stellatus SS14]